MPFPAEARDDSLVVSAVVACYLDSQAIPEMYERLVQTISSTQAQYEIIFVNDGSPDDSSVVLAEIAKQDLGVTVITHSRPFGSQSAFTSGMRVCTGDVCILLDGDLQDPPEVIPEFIEKWREGYEVVYGERVQREAPLHMRVFYKCFYRVFRHLAYVDVPLDAGDFSLLDRSVIDAMNSMPEGHRFLRGLRSWVGFRQIGVPYVRPERPYGETTNNLRKNLGWARRAIVSFSFVPLDLITVIALVVVGFAAVGIVVQVALRLLDPASAPAGLTTLISIVLFLGGIQLLCLAIIGSYLAHMYEEVKRRPPYVVASITNEPGESIEPKIAVKDEIDSSTAAKPSSVSVLGSEE